MDFGVGRRGSRARTNPARLIFVIHRCQVREHGFHRVDATDIAARIVIAAALPFREVKAVSGVEITSARTA